MALTIAVVDARPSAQTASPGITFRLRIEDPSGGHVHAIALRCQVRIEPRGRRYTKEEQARLYELFGDVSQWDRTLRGVAWAHSPLVVPSFEERIEVDLPVACTYDLEIASAKYLHAIRDGDVPLVFLFSGSIFRAGRPGQAAQAGQAGREEQLPPPVTSSARPARPALPAFPALSVEPVSWDVEASFRMPASVWMAAMEQFFPGGGWLRLQRDTIDRLQAFRGRHAVVTWDEAIDLLLQYAASGQNV